MKISDLLGRPAQLWKAGCDGIFLLKRDGNKDCESVKRTSEQVPTNKNFIVLFVLFGPMMEPERMPSTVWKFFKKMIRNLRW